MPDARARGRLRQAVRAAKILGCTIALAGCLLVATESPASAAINTPSLNGVISNLRDWLVGLLVGLATLLLTWGGIRYLTAGGDPMQIDKAKAALKSAAVGYVLAALAPIIVAILQSVVR